MTTAQKSKRNVLLSRGFEREIAPGVRVHIKVQRVPLLPNLWDGLRGRVADAWHSMRSKPIPGYRLR